MTHGRSWPNTNTIVSIHTPTQGVTQTYNPRVPGIGFQSTHPRRVWLNWNSTSKPIRGFNPHTHAGCDISEPKRGKCQLRVSIHTPTQGVTQISKVLDKDYKFQSTHPRRVWLYWHNIWICVACFNPHTHAGCDVPYAPLGNLSAVSIHTPTQGVTLLRFLF